MEGEEMISQEQLSKVAHEQGVGSVVAYVADLATMIGDLPIAVALQTASSAKALANHLLRCKATIADADRGVRALDGFALLAQATVGEALAGLEGGKPGDKAKSPRREAADAAGISRPDAARLVELAGIELGERSRIAGEMEAEGQRLTVRGVLTASKAPSKAEGYDGDEWYTGPGFCDATRKAGGGHIDCDLTSCLLAQRNVRARVWYSLRNPNDPAEQASALAAGMTQAEIDKACACWGGLGEVVDGKLRQAAVGHVFGQPPYSDPAPTIKTILEGYNEGRGAVVSAVILVNVATGTAAQQALLKVSSAQLWVGKGEDNPKARMSFIGPSGEVAKANRYDQVAYFLGKSPVTFAAAFGGWGVVKIG